MITQLIFEHALRIRVKANVAKSTEDSTSTIAVTPDSVSEVESQSSRDHATAGNSSDSNEDTLRASTSSVKSADKGKGKSKKNEWDEDSDGSDDPVPVGIMKVHLFPFAI